MKACECVQNPTKTGVCGDGVLTISETALFSHLIAIPKLPSALQYLVQYCRLYSPNYLYTDLPERKELNSESKRIWDEL